MTYSKELAQSSYASPNWINLYAEGHDGVDDVVIVLLQCLDGLVAGNVGLGHDKFDVLVLKTGGINLLIILLLLGLLSGLALLLLVGVGVAGVVVTSVVVLSSSELGSGGSLSLGVEVLNLGLTEYAIYV